MHDLVVRNARIVDGRGTPAAGGDVAVDDGRITEVGRVEGRSHRTIDAGGRVVAPGFIDVHTHYDVQGFWDPDLTPSPLHGVTTVIGGNCGFTVAPLAGDAAGYLMRMLARVEGMPLASLEAGVPWDWTTTADFLDRLDGRLALNAGFMVGHSALRRVVMGPEATVREATGHEQARMEALLRDGLGAGALGFSSTWSETHNDGEGDPVPSRFASAQELIGLAAVCRDFEGTSLEFLPGVGIWDDAARAVMVDMTVAARRPLNWNVITPTARSLEHWRDKLSVSDVATEAGGKIVGLVLPRPLGSRFCFRTGFIMDAFEGWREPMALPPAQKLAMLRDPAGRERLRVGAAATRGMGKLPDWGAKRIVETFTPETAPYEGRVVAEIAAEEGRHPFDVLVDIVIADDLHTSFCNLDEGESDADWEARAEIWRDPRAVVGASDAGAHLDMLATFSFSTDLLEHGVRRGLLGLEEAVQLLTSVPADLYGLRDRGRLVPGGWADLVVFDPETVGREPVTTRFDLPGGIGRLYAGAVGIDLVVVNGTPIVEGGDLTGARPGTLLRSGLDTTTPSLLP